MKITKLRLVTGLLIVIASLFMVGVLFDVETLSDFSRALILPFLVYLYFTVSEVKSKFFALFLIFCAFAECVKVIMYLDAYALSKVSNIAYILGYISLLLYISKSINFQRLFSKFKVPIIVLTVFNGYLIFVLNQMILADSTIAIYTFEFLIECSYNICILLVLSFSLINYLYHDTKKGLILFLASACIVFSEMVQVAYIFVSSEYILRVAYSVLLIVGFYLLYVYIVSKINTFYKVLF
ncbi:hypothetical protein [Lacinutrix sp. Bg11-31]|uniref:hypothetical protein n=1 Tax=Lacinutrix sp. Bg11-31 TaxID=2057808 RepID=UPI000C318055|nr:hypothetical protein [Lacinutrix sp. Bg11-31]AUC81922.1 hypothetical protein CW733_07180 [Lacinutrix sp. Bg11-31]